MKIWKKKVPRKPLGCRSFRASSKNGNERTPRWLTLGSRRRFLICLHSDRFVCNIWYLVIFDFSILLRIFRSMSSCCWWLASGGSIVPNVSGWSLSPEWVWWSLQGSHGFTKILLGCLIQYFYLLLWVYVLQLFISSY